MTTRVTIDAHAGWPIEVVLHRGEPQEPKPTVQLVIIDPYQERDFFVHSGLRILSIRELPIDDR